MFSGAGVFSERLLAIPKQAAAIQSDLDRVVWNGRLHQVDAASNDFSRALLEEIASTGRRTQGVFEQATDELLDTVTATMLDETRFLSGLAVDILDRNLYERACDCRWWTENATLASLDAAGSAAVLQHINGLYTVYTDILLFDARGTVIGASQDATLVGKVLDEDWVGKCLAVKDRMGYAVSEFHASALYADRGTYIYSAPVFDGGRAVGGVGLVFDAAPQFEAMLEAALPSRSGSIGAFVRPNGELVSATGALPIALPGHVLALQAGEDWSGIVVEDGRCYALGATAGSGYREFKTSDGYVEQVIAVIVVPCGPIVTASTGKPFSLKPVARGVEVATFHLGEHHLALRAKEVIECIEVKQTVRAPGAVAVGARHSGYTTWREMALPLVDLSAELDGPASDHRHAVIMCHDGLHFGLLVSQLGAIVDLEVSPSPTISRLNGRLELITHIARSGEHLVPLLSAACIAELSVSMVTASPRAVPGVSEDDPLTELALNA
jgi:chemotaxis signal transduction protein